MLKNVLIFEDDNELRNQLEIFLIMKGYNVNTSNGKNYKELITNIDFYDLILLDINLPDKSGFEICSLIREKSNLAIIFLTSRSSDIDEIMGLSLGANDFIKKPFNSNILLLRIEKLLIQDSQNIVKYGNLILDKDKNYLNYEDKEIELTKTEFLILNYLIENKNKIVPRIELIEYLWDNESFIDDNTLSVHISRLRSKLKSLGIVDIIKTRHKQGYIL